MKKTICYITTIAVSIEAFFLSQIEYLSQNDFEVTVICTDDGKIRDLLPAGVKYIPVTIPRGISVVGMIKAIFKLFRIIRFEKFDIVQYSTPNAAFCAAIASWIARTKIRNYHLMGYRYLGATGIMALILRTFEKVSCSLSSDIECVSVSNLKLGVENHIFTKSKATVVWNGSTGGVDLNRYDYKKRLAYRNEIRKKYDIGDSEFVFGFVGRITKDKGVNEIWSAFEKIENAKLMMVGDIENKDSLDESLYKCSLENDNVIYTGWTNEPEKFYSAIDVLVLPSYREGFGNVIIEAGAIGTPAIISNIPGPIDAVVDNVTAKIVPVKNVEELHRAMQWFLKQPIEEMGNNAANYVQSSFDSRMLNRKILERKKSLLNKLENKK